MVLNLIHGLNQLKDFFGALFTKLSVLFLKLDWAFVAELLMNLQGSLTLILGLERVGELFVNFIGDFNEEEGFDPIVPNY